MKKRKTPEAVFDELIGILPPRKIVKTEQFRGEDMERAPTNGAGKDLGTEVGSVLDRYGETESERPRFCYICHEKQDGILAAKALSRDAALVRTGRPPVYNPDINETMLSAHIEKDALKRRAVEAGYVESRKVPVWKTIASVIAGIWAVIGIFVQTMDVVSLFDADQTVQSTVRSFGLIDECICLVMLAVFIGITCSIVLQRRRNDKSMIAEIDAKLNDLDDNEFVEFLELLSGDEFYISDCAEGHTDVPCFVCALQSYNFRQRHILNAYWRQTCGKQVWVIFAEDTAANEDYVLGKSGSRDRSFYRMEKLSLREKRRIAGHTYREQVKFSPNEDAGIKNHGADYVCRFQLKEVQSAVDEEFLSEKIREFTREYHSSYQSDLKLMIKLVAELSCNYRIDFKNRRNWEYLFDYNQADPELTALDKEVSARLRLDNSEFKTLVPEIVHLLSDHFEEITAIYPNSEQSSVYEQWCLIKALRCRSQVDEERFSFMADVLMNEFKEAQRYPEDLNTPIWIGIMRKTLEGFGRAQVLWFLPTVIHNLISIRARCGNGASGKLFSLPCVLDAARVDLLLNINTEENGDSHQGIDLIRDHYEVAVRAVGELDNGVNLDNTLGFPPSFGLLRLSNAERQRYYNALTCLKEADVLDYYDRIYDIYCGALLVAGGDMKFTYRDLYKNTLYDKYAKSGRENAPDGAFYIKAALGCLLDRLNSCCGERFPAMAGGIRALTDILRDESLDAEAVTRRTLFLLVKFDILGAVTLNFAACLIARMNGSEGVSKDVYLNLGNYLIALVFLTYHENTQRHFHNDDFIHLVHLATSYTDPCNAVLGYLYYCDTMHKPANSRTLILDFIRKHKAKYLENLQQTVAQLKSEDIEAFLSFVECISDDVMEQEKTEIYKKVKDVISSEYGASPKAPVLLELLTLCIDGCSSPAFSEDTPERNLEKLCEFTGNTVYLVYTRYLECDPASYLELCPRVAGKLLSASMVRRCMPLAQYLRDSHQKDSQEYVATAKLLYEYLLESSLEFPVTVLEMALEFIASMYARKKEQEELYRWLDMDESAVLVTQIVNKREDILLIQAKEFITQRTWGKYGMVLYLRYLLTTSYQTSRIRLKAYAELGETEKLEYMVTHFRELRPILEKGGHSFFDGIYVDMLTAFVNNDGDIQNRLNETECLQKFAEDSFCVIDSLVLVDDVYKEEIRGMIRDYMELINRW